MQPGLTVNQRYEVLTEIGRVEDGPVHLRHNREEAFASR
jgi:hypothetical protein